MPKIKNATNSTTRTTRAKTKTLDSSDALCALYSSDAVQAFGLWAKEVGRDSRDYIPRIVVEERIFSIMKLMLEEMESLDA